MPWSSSSWWRWRWPAEARVVGYLHQRVHWGRCPASSCGTSPGCPPTPGRPAITITLRLTITLRRTITITPTPGWPAITITLRLTITIIIYSTLTLQVSSTRMDVNESYPKSDSLTITPTLTKTINWDGCHLKLNVNAVLHLGHVHDLHQDKGDLF